MDTNTPAPRLRRTSNWLETPEERDEARAAMWAVANNMDHLLRLMTARKSGIMTRLNDCMLPLLDDPKMEKLYNELMDILA